MNRVIAGRLASMPFFAHSLQLVYAGSKKRLGAWPAAGESDAHVPLFGLVLAVCMCLTLLLTPGKAALALPAQGCPKAHCDQANSGFINEPVPGSTATLAWIRNTKVGEKAGSSQGLGCSSNGTLVVCSYAGDAADAEEEDAVNDDVIAYNYSGVRKWTSLNALGPSAYTSAPLILGDGIDADTIAVDAYRAIRFDKQGNQIWNTPFHEDETYGGTPISPVITDSGIVILATSNGPIYAIDNNSGANFGDIIATKFIRMSGDGANDFFDTHKSAAVDGNRVYVSMQHENAGVTDDVARLVAIDVDADAEPPDEVLTVAWFYEFSTGADVLPDPGEGSKSSPMLMKVGDDDKAVLFFDGWYWAAPDDSSDAVVQIFAVQDDGGTDFTLKWNTTPDVQTFAAFLPDPSGDAFWHVQHNNRYIVRRDVDTGDVTDSIDLDTLIGHQTGQLWVACSAMTIAGTQQAPYMIVAARGFPSVNSVASHVLAINLAADPQTMLWKYTLNPAIIPTGQFPIVKSGSDPRVVFTAIGPAVRAIGAP
jgi:hypothetical protein